jgi:hypothetical protein
MSHHNKDGAPSEELCQTLSKILNIPEEKVARYYFLFREIDSNIKNSLHYLSQIEEEDLKISASFCLEFLAKYKKYPL